MYDLIIIGAGPAGCAAAIYAARYKLKTLMIYSDMGQTASAWAVHNYPGFKEIGGIELINKMLGQAKNTGIEAKNAEVTNAEKTRKGFIIKTNDRKKYESKTLLLACGSKHKKLNVKGEKEFIGKGVSYCAACDAPMFAGKTAVVAGASDSAAKTSLLLAKYADKVYILSRSMPRAEPVNMELMKKEKKIAIIKGEIKEIKGDKLVKSVLLKSGKEIKADGIFIEVGMEPSTGLAEQLKAKLDNSHIKVDSEQKTNVNGLFAAGNITNRTRLKQIITAAGEGAIAAEAVYRHLQSGSK